MRRAPAVDAKDYLRAFVLLVKHPVVALGPLAASLILMLSGGLMPAGDGGFSLVNGIIGSIFAVLVNSIGLGFALIAADKAWRYDRATISDTWSAVRIRIGDIFMAGLGYTFVTYIAGYIGTMLGGIGLPGFAYGGTLVLGMLVTYFLMYTMPAASIGGIPGGAALNASVERARSAPIPTLVLLLIYYATYTFATRLVSMFAGNVLLGFGMHETVWLSTLIYLVVQSLLGGYFSLVLAKTYNGISYRRIW